MILLSRVHQALDFESFSCGATAAQNRTPSQTQLGRQRRVSEVVITVFGFTHVLFLVALMASDAFAQSPYQFKPSGGDDAAGLRAALIAYRWVQINGTDIRIDTPIHLENYPGAPLHNILVEPAPGINQTTIHSAIPQDATNPTNPSRSVFNYNGGFVPGSFLTTNVPAGVTSITIRNPQLLWSDGRRSRAFQVG